MRKSSDRKEGDAPCSSLSWCVRELRKESLRKEAQRDAAGGALQSLAAIRLRGGLSNVYSDSHVHLGRSLSRLDSIPGHKRNFLSWQQDMSKGHKQPGMSASPNYVPTQTPTNAAASSTTLHRSPCRMNVFKSLKPVNTSLTNRTRLSRNSAEIADSLKQNFHGSNVRENESGVLSYLSKDIIEGGGAEAATPDKGPEVNPQIRASLSGYADQYYKKSNVNSAWRSDAESHGSVGIPEDDSKELKILAKNCQDTLLSALDNYLDSRNGTLGSEYPFIDGENHTQNIDSYNFRESLSQDDSLLELLNTDLDVPVKRKKVLIYRKPALLKTKGHLRPKTENPSPKLPIKSKPMLKAGRKPQAEKGKTASYKRKRDLAESQTTEKSAQKVLPNKKPWSVVDKDKASSVVKDIQPATVCVEGSCLQKQSPLEYIETTNENEALQKQEASSLASATNSPSKQKGLKWNAKKRENSFSYSQLYALSKSSASNNRIDSNDKHEIPPKSPLGYKLTPPRRSFSSPPIYSRDEIEQKLEKTNNLTFLHSRSKSFDQRKTLELPSETASYSPSLLKSPRCVPFTEIEFKSGMMYGHTSPIKHLTIPRKSDETPMPQCSPGNKLIPQRRSFSCSSVKRDELKTVQSKEQSNKHTLKVTTVRCSSVQNPRKKTGHNKFNMSTLKSPKKKTSKLSKEKPSTNDTTTKGTFRHLQGISDDLPKTGNMLDSGRHHQHDTSFKRQRAESIKDSTVHIQNLNLSSSSPKKQSSESHKSKYPDKQKKFMKESNHRMHSEGKPKRISNVHDSERTKKLPVQKGLVEYVQISPTEGLQFPNSSASSDTSGDWSWNQSDGYKRDQNSLTLSQDTFNKRSPLPNSGKVTGIDDDDDDNDDKRLGRHEHRQKHRATSLRTVHDGKANLSPRRLRHKEGGTKKEPKKTITKTLPRNPSALKNNDEIDGGFLMRSLEVDAGKGNDRTSCQCIANPQIPNDVGENSSGLLEYPCQSMQVENQLQSGHEHNITTPVCDNNTLMEFDSVLTALYVNTQRTATRAQRIKCFVERVKLYRHQQTKVKESSAERLTNNLPLSTERLTNNLPPGNADDDTEDEYKWEGTLAEFLVLFGILLLHVLAYALMK